MQFDPESAPGANFSRHASERAQRVVFAVQRQPNWLIRLALSVVVLALAIVLVLFALVLIPLILVAGLLAVAYAFAKRLWRDVTGSFSKTDEDGRKNVRVIRRDE